MRTSDKESVPMCGAVIAVATGALWGCGDQEPGQQAPVEQVQGAAVGAPGSCANAPDASVCACMDADFVQSPGRPCMIFSGSSQIIPSHFFMNLSLAPYSALYKQISSIWVGPAVKARVCNNPGDVGPCTNYGPNTLIANLYGTGFQDSIASIRVDGTSDDCMSPGKARVTFFEGANFTGDCVVANVGEYPNPFTNATSSWTGGGFGLNDNVISSAIGGGLIQHYTLWDQANFLGTHRSFVGNISNFAASALARCVTTIPFAARPRGTAYASLTFRSSAPA